LRLEGNIEQQAELFYLNAIDNRAWVEESLMAFIAFEKERSKNGEISDSTIPNYYRATKLFCEMNDITLNWKKIARGLPRAGKAANDRAPTIAEIRKLVEYPDRRIKPIVKTMVSSGIRIGAWDYLKWKHVTPVFQKESNEVTAAKLIVYAGESDEYYTFITPEAYLSLKEWMDFRKDYGEKISGESWVMRDLWQTTNIKYGAKLGLATCPKKLKSSGIKRLLERALWEQGLRQPLTKGIRRHEWKAAHGFRKYYKSHAEQLMRPINVEITMGHNIGVSASYYRPTEQQVLEDYLKAAEMLTVNDDKLTLQKQVAELTEKSKEENYVIKGKLSDREKEIQLLRRRDSMNTDAIASLSDQLAQVMQEIEMIKKQK
jgi:hypothetical protein